MQKHILTGLLLFFSFTTCRSQVLIAMLFGDKLQSDKMEFGMTLGNSFSTVTNVTDSKWRLGGFNFGLFFNIKVSEKNNHWWIHTGVIPKMTLGLSELPVYPTGYGNMDTVINSFEGFKVKRSMGYINMPALVRYQIKSGFFVEAGPTIAMRVKSKDVFETCDCYSREECDQDNTLTYTRNLKDDLLRFDVGINAGIGYKIKKKAEISASYNRGFLDIDKRIAGTQNNQFCMLNVNIIVGAKKKGKSDKAKAKEKAPVEVGEGVKINTPGTEIKVFDKEQPAEK